MLRKPLKCIDQKNLSQGEDTNGGNLVGSEWRVTA